MAMPLGLKAILYGVDKIPDSWFERVPGGYYGKPDKDNKNDKKDKRQSGRYPDGYSQYNGYQSEGDSGRRSRNKRNDYYDDSDDRNEQRRSRKNRTKSLGAERGSYDEPRYDTSNGMQYSQQRQYNPTHYSPAQYNPADYAASPAQNGAPYPENYYAGQNPQADGSYAKAAAAAGAMAGVAAATNQHQQYDEGRRSSTIPGTGYVPYADVYSSQYQQANNGNYPVQNNGAIQYSQYPGQPYGQANPQGYSYDQQSQFQPTDQQNGERGRYAESPSRSSSSSGSYERRRRSKAGKKSRSRSRSRARSFAYDDGQQRPKSQHRGHFDLTERGLGYGALGAIGGGLIGSEVGHGIWPVVAGALVGGLGANAYEHKEQRKQNGRRDSGQFGNYIFKDRNKKRASRAYDGNQSE